jgi:hypothetical protein
MYGRVEVKHLVGAALLVLLSFSRGHADPVGETHRLTTDRTAVLRDAERREQLRVTVWYPAIAAAQDFFPGRWRKRLSSELIVESSQNQTILGRFREASKVASYLISRIEQNQAVNMRNVRFCDPLRKCPPGAMNMSSLEERTFRC